MSRHSSKYQMKRESKPRLTPQQKEDLILATINQAVAEEPLTLKGIAVTTGLDMANDVKFYCDKLLREKRINVKEIPDSFYPQVKVRAFFRKF